MCRSRGTQGSSLGCAALGSPSSNPQPHCCGVRMWAQPSPDGEDGEDTWTEPRSPAQDPSTLRRQQWLSESGLVSLIAALLLPVASPSPAAEVLLFLFLFLWKSAEQLVWSLVKHPRVMKRLRAELFLPPDAGGAGGGSQRLMRSLCVTSLEAAPVLFLVIFHLPEAPLTPAGNRAADMARSSPRTSPSFSLCPLGLEAPSWLQNCSHPAANKPSRLTEPAMDPT